MSGVWWSAYAVGTRVTGRKIDVDSLQVFVRAETEDQAKGSAILELTKRCPSTGNIAAFAAPCPVNDA